MTARAKGREDRRELGSGRRRAHDRHGPRERAQLPHVGMGERELAAREREAASVATRRDDEPVRLEDLAAGLLDAVRADEADRPATGDQRDAGSREVPGRAASSPAAHRPCAGSRRAALPGPRSPARSSIRGRAEPVGRQLLDVAEQSRGLREHARGRTPVVRAGATRPVALDERDARPELRRTQRRGRASRTPADDDQVEALHPRSVASVRRRSAPCPPPACRRPPLRRRRRRACR